MPIAGLLAISFNYRGFIVADDKSELDKAVEDWRENQAPAQLALIESDDAAVEAKRGRGRPAGSRNLRTEAYAALLKRNIGDPLVVAVRIAAKDVLDPDVVAALAKTWGCDRYEAVKLWAQINRDTQPYVNQQLPRAIVLNPGAPGGERIGLEIDGEFQEIPMESDDAA